MFRKWLSENSIKDIDFSTPLYTPAKDREFWDSRYDATIVKDAEEKMGFNWPVIKATDFMEFDKSGDRLCMQTPYDARRSMLNLFALAEILEHKGRFLPDIVNGLFAVCEETYWGLSAHKPPFVKLENIPDPQAPTLDLFAGETASDVSIIYHILYDELYDFCPEILKRIEDEIERRIEIPFINRRDFWWQGYQYPDVNNWNPWILSNILTATLVVEHRRTYRTRIIEKALYELEMIYNRYPDDGGCDEGIVYWTASGARFFEFFENLYIASNGKVNFFTDEKAKRVFSYPLRAYVGNNYFVNYSDGGCHIGYHGLTPGFLYILGKRTGETKFFDFAVSRRDDKGLQEQRTSVARVANFKRVLNDYVYKYEVEALEGEYRPEDYVLPNLQVSFMRAGGFYYSAKGGHNSESHNHNDVGSCVCYYDENPIIIDSGNAVYTKKTFTNERYTIWTNQSSWHNLPTINGQMQLPGWQKRADVFEVSGKETTVGFKLTYPEEAMLSNVIRKYNVDENGVYICDNFEFTQDKNEVIENFLTCRNVKVDGNNVIFDDEFVLSPSIPVEVIVERVNFENDSVLTVSWPQGYLDRVSFKFVAGKTAEIKFELKRKA